MKLHMQLAPHIGRSRVKAWIKRATNRFLRRRARRDLENAPVRRFYGGWWW